MDARLRRARAALEAVTDPEIPVVTIGELGILRDVQVDETGTLVATITPTYSGCPAMDQIADDVGHALQAADVGPYRVRSVLSPAWTTDWMTAEGRRKLREFGIAPPMHRADAGDARAIHLVRPAQAQHVPCPQCGSQDTVLVSAFGSTACKSLYRCRACREPFDYFKPY
ncbi:Putative 1,2-phenylacetyl-CoA epoxidase, subunit D [Ralstonia mannitolilytica]|uniref:1,2-phenylacetyl-CoA epoxidase subunit PaaD n=1 Tax=Ralstonia mannitolilytica TaxID=105219 RepID=UPI0028F57D3C|nr:1,2-phenylacetyl-CoA epoxidase subunit PaaD [Ralstonia mannitolilytica]CAJ0789312.1 Putative 1,2-phenylacetyl-CoA epoxidase, subunit D [Ralstonia mannitolilytica]